MDWRWRDYGKYSTPSPPPDFITSHLQCISMKQRRLKSWLERCAAICPVDEARAPWRTQPRFCWNSFSLFLSLSLTLYLIVSLSFVCFLFLVFFQVTIILYIKNFSWFGLFFSLLGTKLHGHFCIVTVSVKLAVLFNSQERIMSIYTSVLPNNIITCSLF